MSKLRSPERLEALNEIRDIPVGSLPAHVLQRLFDGRPPVPTIDDVQPIWCDRHRAYHGVPIASTARRCGWCTSCLVGQSTLRGGRPRRYCSDSCKQAAYRARRAESRSGADTRPNDVSPPKPATP